MAPAFRTARGALYQTDCLHMLGQLKDDSVDCVFADPPFNIGKVYGKIGEVNDALTRQQYLDWCFAWIDEAVRVCVPGGAVFIYILPQWGYHFAARLEQQGMLFRHWIALTMKGSFPRGNKLYPAHYALLYFTKGTPRAFTKARLPIPVCRHCGKDVKDYGGHRKFLNPAGLSLTDFWEDTSPARHSKFKARAGVNELKPMIPARCLEIATKPGDLIVDPFGGGGSTFEAAELGKRYWIGTEITDCSIISDRFALKFPNLPSDSKPAEKIRKAFRDADAALSIPTVAKNR